MGQRLQVVLLHIVHYTDSSHSKLYGSREVSEVKKLTVQNIET